MVTKFLSRSERQTFEYARELAGSLELPARILLIGELGAGKTSFTKGVAAGFGVEDVDEVSSPTFTLVNQYEGRVPVYHVDLYRVESTDLYDLGLDDIFDEQAVVVVEWAERLAGSTPENSIRITLTYVDEHTRQIERS
jgi:tRNA threonylcarbamoyladenosine biosynthesis protein TsaE